MENKIKIKISDLKTMNDLQSGIKNEYVLEVEEERKI
jgi:hypothetical protein